MSTAVADWPKFLAKLKDRQEIAERTMAFRFEKPASFKFTPGQFIDITLLNPPETDSEGNARNRRNTEREQKYGQGRRRIDGYARHATIRGECEMQNQARTSECDVYFHWSIATDGVAGRCRRTRREWFPVDWSRPYA